MTLRRRYGLWALAFAGGIFCLTAIGFLVSGVVRELRLLRTANADNVQWSLSQAEVEFLEFQLAVRRAADDQADDGALALVVLEFDVFYSRMTILATGALYAALKPVRSFSAPLDEIITRLDAMIPLIDGPRDELRAGLDDIDAQNTEMRYMLREMATGGLSHFTRASDMSRETVNRTLFHLALVTTGLFVALCLLLFHTRMVRRQVERSNRELTEAYARQNTILETSLDAVAVTDIDGRLLNFNAAAESIFGYRRDEAIGKNIADLFVPDHLRAAHLAGVEAMKRTDEPKLIGKGRMRLEAKRRNGELFPIELALERARTGDGMIIVGFLRDISRRVEAEKELTDARDKALAGEKAKADFLAMMTHEIRTPLNGLLGNLSLLAGSSHSEQQARYIRNMRISGDVLMGHVDAVLDVARFEAGAATRREEAAHPGHLLQELVDGQSGAAELAGNRLEWRWSGPATGWIRTDVSRLRQVLLNLVGNANKFTRNGCIQIEAERVGPRGDPMLEIRVIDSGAGIAEADLERIFDDFQTMPGNQAVGGTGLGLGIARRFISAMDGEIGVESTPGEGSLFWIKIPLIPADPPADPGGEGCEAEASPCKILLAEDVEISRELAREMLTMQGHQVTEARTGVEAVNAAARETFALILMDIRMPDMDGLAATRAIRRSGGPNAGTPVIALSANVLPGAKEDFREAGMSGFLAKPLSQEELKRVISRFCAGGPAKENEGGAGKFEALRLRHIDDMKAFFDWLAAEPEDLREIAFRAHKLAAAAAAFSQPDLHKALILLELAAEQGGPDELREAAAAAKAAWLAAPAPVLG